MRIVSIVLTVVVLNLSLPLATAAPRCVDLFKSSLVNQLEIDANFHLNWVRSQNAKLNARLAQSPNRTTVQELVRKHFENEETVQVTTLKDGRKLKLIDRGLGRPMEIVLVDGEQMASLFSNQEIAKNDSYRIDSLSVSPLGRWLAIIGHDDGSIDSFRLVVYDLKERKTVRADLLTKDPLVGWLSADRLVAHKVDMSGDYEFDPRKKDRVAPSKWGRLYASSRGWTAASAGDGYVFRHFDGTEFSLDDVDLNVDLNVKIKGGPIFYAARTANGHRLWLATHDADDNDQITEVSIYNSGRKRLRTLPVGAGRAFNSYKAWSNDDAVVIEGYWGAFRKMVIAHPIDGSQQDITLPQGTRIFDVSWKENGLFLTLESTVQKLTYRFDVTTHKFFDGDAALTTGEVERRMHFANGIQYATKVEWVDSHGTKIPMRLTYRDGMKADGLRGMLIRVYGGFGVAENIYGQYDPLVVEFMERGGVLVAPALRGGNEFGPKWHKAAQFAKKEVTLDDLIATSQHLVAAGYTTFDRIVTQGTSNGGMVVAAAALKSPESFGLVIAINGLHNMLRKDDYDAPYNGFAHDFGDARKPREYKWIAPYSPVQRAELVSKSPGFLIITGANDSRVTTLHSDQLAAALQGNPKIDPAKIDLLSVKNAGHWQLKVLYQGLISARSQLILWTHIYDHLGWQI